MSFLLDVIIIFISFTIFGLIHSFLASNKVKRKIGEKLGNLIAFYRILYNLISISILYLIYILIPKPDIMIYDLPPPFDLAILVPQILSLIGMIWTIKYFSVSEFLGISQIIRWFNGEYKKNELDEKLTLRIEGPYKFVRHPLYFFVIIFLISRPLMDLFYLTILICLIAYFYIGSYYEEKKLVEQFSKEYLSYRKAVPRLFPLNFFNPYAPKKI